jgi:hypothetical protein
MGGIDGQNVAFDLAGGFRAGPHPGVHGDFAAVDRVLANDGQFRTAVAAGLQLRHDDHIAAAHFGSRC